MARSVAEINQFIVDTLVTNFASAGITINPTLWSKRNLLRSICYTVAVCQAILEQLQDLFMVQIEAKVAIAAAASFMWIQSKMFQFQYSADNPQFVVFVNGVPAYPVIDPTLNIITACSVTSSASNTVTIKTATGSPLAALPSLVVTSAQGYVDTIGAAGINYLVVSLNPDQLYLNADIYFQSQYASVIQANVIAAITNWLATQSVTNFNGLIKMSDIENMIRNIPGVTDVQLKNIRGRADSVAFAAGIDLILNSQVIQRQYSTSAGYMIPETTVGKTLTDSLNLIAA